MTEQDHPTAQSRGQSTHEAERQQRELPGTPLGTESIRNIQTICAGSPVPVGWIKTNDHWDPTKCGMPTNSSTYNIWTITRYDNSPVGTVMDVCANAPIPDGWMDVGTRWDPTACGYPTTVTQNIRQIKRSR